MRMLGRAAAAHSRQGIRSPNIDPAAAHDIGGLVDPGNAEDETSGGQATSGIPATAAPVPAPAASSATE
jgi:hypothetical protein